MIVGEFLHSDTQVEPRVLASIQLVDISPSWVGIDFLLDTGAGWSCLHPGDALYAGISATALVSPERWADTVTFQGIGGLEQYHVTPVRYAFRHHDGTTQFLDERIYVAPRTPLNLGLPSLLGWDVLRRFGILADWSTGRLELHSPRSFADRYPPQITE